jgi:isopentenyl phosphate kinase
MHPSGLLYFLKLGGSLITDKTKPRAPRMDILDRLAAEIAAACAEKPALRLVVGNGAGSFGHIPARRYGTRQGVRTPEDWRGFAEVWHEADALNRLVINALHVAGLPAVAFPPSASVTARDGQVSAWDLSPIRNALQAGLLPVVHGDVIFDTVRGGTILSTEDLFEHLARQVHPERILLAGLEDGVWADYPTCTRLIPEITPKTLPQLAPALGGSSATDVTGGMASKVRQSLALVDELPGLEILIFSGEKPGQVKSALLGVRVGTSLRKK